MNKLPKLKLYVELDCLLDTRIGTVAMISNDLATNVLKNNYHQRQEDVFDGVDNNTFKELYCKRNIDTLKHSTITTFMPLLRHLCELIYEEAISRPYHSGPEIVLNVYPYFMTDDVATAIRTAIERWVGNNTPVTLSRIEPKNLKPIICRDFSLMVMYDPTEWFNENLEELVKKPLRDVTLYIPQLYRNRQGKTDEEIAKETEEVMNPFAALDLVMKSIIDINQLDVYYFSIFDPKAIIDFSNFYFSSHPHQTDS